MTTEPDSGVASVLSRIPSGLYVLTAADQSSRSGTILRWMQQCSSQPPMVMLSIRKGHPIATLICSTRNFAVCELDINDTHLIKRFEARHDVNEDPFIGLGVIHVNGNPPVLAKSKSYIECELARHLDIDSDHELYVGHVKKAHAQPI